MNVSVNASDPTLSKQRRTLRVSPDIQVELLHELAAFGWVTGEKRWEETDTPQSSRIAVYGAPRQRLGLSQRHLVVELSRLVSAERHEQLDLLEDAYFALADTRQSSVESKLAPMGCPMMVGVVALAVFGLQIFKHGLNEMAQWSLVVGAMLVTPFALTLWNNRKARRSTQVQVQDLSARKTQLINEARALLEDKPRPPAAPPPIQMVRAQPKPNALAVCPFHGQVVTIRGGMVFGHLTRTGDILLTIGTDWGVWKGSRAVGEAWAWVDSRGEIHQGARPQGVAPDMLLTGNDVIAHFEDRRLIVGENQVGRLTRNRDLG